MSTVTPVYSAVTAITMDLSALATSASFGAGRECSEISNATNKYIDAIVDGRFIVGTTPAAGSNLYVFVWGANTSLATIQLDTLDGTDSNESFTNLTTLAALRIAATVSISVATSNIVYAIPPFSIAAQFGGILPKYWGLYVSHNTGSALKTDAGNTNSFNYIGVKYDIT